MASRKDTEYIAVVAIDFGSTSSGYGMSMKNKKKDVFIHTGWGRQSNIPFLYKTPTCVLTNDKDEFVAMGYDAMEQFNIMDPEETSVYRFFEGFKMALHNRKGLDDRIVINDSLGRDCRAMDIFVMVIRALKEHALAEMKKPTGGRVSEELVRWVITVPAIWSDRAKHFMRTAAFKAGLVDSLDSPRLLLALEPEAASLYCRELSEEDFVDHSERHHQLTTGSRYLVVDAGGGTLDVTAHEVLPGGQLAELYHTNGGPLGADLVNKRFIELLDTIFDQKFTTIFKEKQPAGFNNLLAAFETTKKIFNPKNAKASNIQLSAVMSEFFLDEFGKRLPDCLLPEYISQGFRLSSGILRIPSTAMNDLFSPLIKDIVGHIRELLAVPALSSVSCLVMVGGFSDSPALQAAVLEEFGETHRVLIPQDAVCAVIKGAVMYGHAPDAIRVRIARRTYGIGGTKTYDTERHPADRVMVIDGVEKVDNVFWVLVARGTAVEKDEVVQETYTPLYIDQGGVLLPIVSTFNENPVFIDEPGVEVVGNLKILLPGSGKVRKVQVTFKFGGTELEVEARDVREGGDVARTTLDFFSR